MKLYDAIAIIEDIDDVEYSEEEDIWKHGSC
jgi:hypothetical protein